MIKGILFDLDGTLLDRDKSLLSFIDNQYERFQAMKIVEKSIFIQRFIELDQKGYVWKDEVYQKLTKELNIDVDWEILLQDYLDFFQNHCIAYPGLTDILDFLQERNIKLGIITNGFGKFQMDNIKGLHIEHYFDAIFISEIEGIRKPNIEIFQRAMNRLGVEPNESLFVGDHPINDVEASFHAGMKAIWKEDHSFEVPSCEHIRIKDLIEMKEIVQGLNSVRR